MFHNRQLFPFVLIRSRPQGKTESKDFVRAPAPGTHHAIPQTDHTA